MRLHELKNSEEGEAYMHFSYQEEQALAQWVMALFMKPWIDTPGSTDIYKILKTIWWAKCENGYDLLASWYLKLAELVDKRNAEYIEQIPQPDALIEMNDVAYQVPTQNDNGDKYTPEERIRLRREAIRRIWRDEWREHPIRTAVEGFEVFPGDEPDQTYTDLQVEREVRFWDEVGRRQKEYGVSRDQAIRAVSDYMPRGQFPEGELEDPITDRSMLELMEVEYPDPPPLPDIDDLPEY